MDLERLATWAPTLASSAVFTAVHATFALGVRRGRRRALERASAQGGPSDRVSVLKPVAGLDEELAENLASFARQEHDGYELLFGFATRDDPALAVVRRFLDGHPNMDGRVVFTDPDAARNPKVAQLIGLAKAATGEVLVISDANVRVPPTYLSELSARLAEPGIGLVSSLIVGAGERSLGAILESAQLGAYVAPAVVASSAIASRTIAIGKSMAFRRADLERIGGLEVVGNVLAEDDVLGQRFRAVGLGVAVSFVAVENRNVTGSLARALDRHTRWTKMRRAIAPVCFAVEPLASPVMVALLVALALPSSSSLRAIAFAVMLQLLGATVAHGVLRSRAPKWQLVAAEPLRWLLAFTCWLRAWFSRSIVWRGHALLIGRGTELYPLERSRAVPEPTRDVLGA